MQYDDNWLAGPGFTWKKGYALISACKLAYADTDEMARVLSQIWRVRATVFSQGDTQGFVAEGDRAVTVAFRGTKGLADWLSNIDVVAVQSDIFRGRVHRGFLDAFGDSAGTVANALAGTGNKALWITGHSLGGAVALAAAATHLGRAPAGLITFGQPRMLKRDAAEFIAGALGSRYIRIVNDNDIVAKVPPGYSHTGGLLHFGFDGGLLAEAVAEADDPAADLGPAPLSAAEFEAFQDSLRRARAAATAAEIPPGTEGHDTISADAAIEGLIPGVEPHRIDNYLHLVRRKAGIGAAPSGAAAVAAVHNRPELESAGVEVAHIFRSESGAPRQPVLLRLTDTNWTPRGSLKVQSRVGRIVTAMANEGNLRDLEDDPLVATIEVSRDAGIEDLDISVPFVGAAAIHRPPLDERGEAAIVGVIDTGIDILHETFRDAAGKTRILAIWDQRATQGPTPREVDPDAFSQDYGRLWLAGEIDAFIAGTSPVPMPGALRDPAGHGSHVAGIAAGRAVGLMADGMAPGARLIGVIANITQKPGEPPSLGYSMSHVDGLAFMRRAAQGGSPVLTDGLPIAINVSLGMNAGAHDGTTTLEAAFDGITGGGRDAGVAIVKSAGNERVHAGHTKVQGFQGGVADIRWTSSSRFRMQDYFEAWFSFLDDFAFRVVDPLGNASPEVSFGAPVVEADLGGNAVRLELTELHPDNGDHRLAISIGAAPNAIQDGEWRLDVFGNTVQSPEGEVHIWVERAIVRAVRFATEDPEMTLSIPGTARTVIAVGAGTAEDRFRLTESSSWGPTRDLKLKPELCAPGFQIRSASSNASDLSATTVKTGTSMAAPHVTGALALVLSHRKKAGRPLPNAVQLRSALINAIEGTSGRHNVGAGYGMLDAGKLYEDMT